MAVRARVRGRARAHARGPVRVRARARARVLECARARACVCVHAFARAHACVCVSACACACSNRISSSPRSPKVRPTATHTPAAVETSTTPAPQLTPDARSKSALPPPPGRQAHTNQVPTRRSVGRVQTRLGATHGVQQADSRWR
eukprot:6204474-Pleurochrysis_carterae.AAC.1